ncbi:TetR/AcrR family transcriptional regulator C-terminal domain-containing protein [Micromonospora sp. NPDC050397]|uniref:TetR/AcrR family transcriptional regulator C-terminal domain-containing protein n=1 Tax=Micromonospora sp. NPDC050397 TaxID=3364279 RepID=UPI0038510773
MGTTRGEVVSAALQILDERGLDGLTMRAVAERLGVQHNTVRWHAASKGRLLELASDELLAHCADEPLPRPWDERIWELSQRLRAALLSRRDGARMITVACGPDPHSLRYAEAVVSTLIGAGFDGRTASWAHWTIFYLTLGIAQEQQVSRDSTGAVITADQVPAERYPTLAATLAHIGPGDFDQRFDFGLGLILDSLRARLAARSGTN